MPSLLKNLSSEAGEYLRSASSPTLFEMTKNIKFMVYWHYEEGEFN